MRLWRALGFVFLLVLCGSATAMVATAATTVTCAKGQVSTKAKPCTPAKKVSTTPAGPGVGSTPGDTGPKSGSPDVTTIIRFLDPSENKYQIEVVNTSGIGYINTFTWVPPGAMTITAITSTEGGHCALVGNTIQCTGGQKGIAPPKCTCMSGASMLVNFTATGDQPTFNGTYWTHYGVVGSYTEITSMTPVPYHIPSTITPSSGEDLPLCAQGQKSTAAKPCSLQ